MKNDTRKAAEKTQKAADEAQKISVEAQKLADEEITNLKFDFFKPLNCIGLPQFPIVNTFFKLFLHVSKSQ